MRSFLNAMKAHQRYNNPPKRGLWTMRQRRQFTNLPAKEGCDNIIRHNNQLTREYVKKNK
eukprot:scaffold76612_cov23-Cyclotella_meneghiniana.AAC.1